MKLWSILAFIGFVLVTIAQLNTADLRGWPPAQGPDDLANPETDLEPTRPGRSAFKLGECIRRTIAYDVPTAEEYSGPATLAVITCRSRSGAIFSLAAYTLAAAGLLALVRIGRRKRAARN